MSKINPFDMPDTRYFEIVLYNLASKKKTTYYRQFTSMLNAAEYSLSLVYGVNRIVKIKEVEPYHD